MGVSCRGRGGFEAMSYTCLVGSARRSQARRCHATIRLSQACMIPRAEAVRPCPMELLGRESCHGHGARARSSCCHVTKRLADRWRHKQLEPSIIVLTAVQRASCRVAMSLGLVEVSASVHPRHCSWLERPPRRSFFFVIDAFEESRCAPRPQHRFIGMHGSSVQSASSCGRSSFIHMGATRL